MKAFFQNRITIAVVSFIVGALSLHAVKSYIIADKESNITSARKAIPPMFDEFYNDDFFGYSLDPFKSLQKMREHMKRQFMDSNEGTDIFDSWYGNRFGGGNVNEISQKEDENFVYYEIRSPGLKKEDLKIEIAGGIIQISGKVEKKNSDGGSQSYFSSSFNRSFPIPNNVDPQKVEMLQEGEAIILKFPKYR